MLVLTCVTTTGILNWRSDGLIVSFRTTSTLGATLPIEDVDYQLTDVKGDRLTSTATIHTVVSNDNGKRVYCGNGETEVSRDIIVARLGMFASS